MVYDIWMVQYMVYEWYIWMVVSTSQKIISQFGGLFPIYGKIRNVPNHQPAMYIYIYLYMYNMVYWYQ